MAINRTLALLPRLKAKVTAWRAPLLRKLESRLDLCADLREILESALVEDPPLNPRDGGVIRRGYAPDLDAEHDIAKGGKEWLIQYQDPGGDPQRHRQPQGRL